MLIGQNYAGLLTKPVRAKDHGFTPSCLSPNLVILKSPLNPKLLLSGELGINPLLFDKNYPIFKLSKAEFNFASSLVQNEEKISKIIDGMSQSIKGVARSGPSNPESVNINVVTTENTEYGNVNNKCGNVNNESKGLANLVISKDERINTEAVKICQQDINNWPGHEVSVNYRDKTTNLQSEVLGRFIQAEAGVTLNSPRCEMHEHISKECKTCNFVNSGMSLLDLQSYKEI